jgi:hypothetical protein
MLGQGSYFAWAASYSLEGYARRVRLQHDYALNV